MANDQKLFVDVVDQLADAFVDEHFAVITAVLRPAMKEAYRAGYHAGGVPDAAEQAHDAALAAGKRR